MNEGIASYLGKLKKKQFQGLLQAAIRYNNIKNPDIETDSRLQELFDHTYHFTRMIESNRERSLSKQVWKPFRLDEKLFVKTIIDYACLQVNLKGDK